MDGDVEPIISSTGKECTRDIVQFVPFSHYKNDFDALARETLAEIPQQVNISFKCFTYPNPSVVLRLHANEWNRAKSTSRRQCPEKSREYHQQPRSQN